MIISKLRIYAGSPENNGEYKLPALIINTSLSPLFQASGQNDIRFLRSYLIDSISITMCTFEMTTAVKWCKAINQKTSSE